jgi:hypothetical protein
MDVTAKDIKKNITTPDRTTKYFTDDRAPPLNLPSLPATTDPDVRIGDSLS